MAVKTTPAYKLALKLAFEAEKNFSRFKRLFDEVEDKKLLSHSIIMAGQMISSDTDAQQKLYKAAHKHLSLPANDPIDSVQKAAIRANKLAKREAISGESDRRPAPTFINIDIEVLHIVGVINNALSQMALAQKENKSATIYLAHIGRAINNLLYKIKTIDNLHTRYSYISRIKTAINDQFEGDHLELVKKYTSRLHDDVATRFKKRYYQTKVINRKKYTLSACEVNRLIKEAEDEIVRQSAHTKSWAKLAVCLALVTGRRPYEICKIGAFSVEDSHNMTMSGLAKQKNIEDFIAKSVTFPTLINANMVMMGIQALRQKKDFSVFDNYRAFDKSASTPMRKALFDADGSYKSILHIESQDIKLTPKMLRQVYAAIAKYHLQKQFPRKTDTFYDHKLADILGHNAETDIQTVQSYKDFAVFDDVKESTD